MRCSLGGPAASASLILDVTLPVEFAVWRSAQTETTSQDGYGDGNLKQHEKKTRPRHRRHTGVLSCISGKRGSFFFL